MSGSIQPAASTLPPAQTAKIWKAAQDFEAMRAAGMLLDKRSAVAAFDAAPAPSEAVQRMARRLQALAMENKRLLERAIAVQGRVIGVVGRAATAAMEPAGYGPGRGRRPAAMAFVARA
jgi:hypothetical protein